MHTMKLGLYRVSFLDRKISVLTVALTNRKAIQYARAHLILSVGIHPGDNIGAKRVAYIEEMVNEWADDAIQVLI